jgi:hypothetical protein
MPGPAWSTAIKVNLYVGFPERHAGWTPIDNTAECDAMALTKRRNDKILTDTIPGH